MIDKRVNLKYDSKNLNIKLNIQGSVFDHGLPLPAVVKYLSATQSIFDKTYLYHAQKKVISPKERALFYLESSNIKKGSLYSDLAMVFNASQQLLPFIGMLNPEAIWEYTKSTFDFLKLIFNKKNEGFDVDIQTIGEDAHVHFTNGDTNISYVFNGPVINIAKAALPHYEAIVSGISSGKIDNFKLSESCENEISLTKEDSKIFELPSKISENPISLTGEIFEFDKYTKSGKISIFKEQSIPSGSMNFSVIGNQAALEYIEAMILNSVTVRCLEEKVDHPLYGIHTIGLNVLNVTNK